MPRRLGAELAALRSARFVGRHGERELFAAGLAAEPSPWFVLWLHGPGGIGKSSLLDRFASAATDTGAGVVEIDGRAIAERGDPPLATIRHQLQRFTPTAGPPGRLVVLIDSFERIAAVEDELRATVVPSLDDSALVVIAGRHGPSPEWRMDPAWRERLRIVSVRNLSPREAHEYLQRSGVEAAAAAVLVEASHGHPLALSLMADLAVRAAPVLPAVDDPDLVTTLLRRTSDGLPSALHRKAVEVCAIARVTTEHLLRDALGLDDARALFDWLRQQSFVESGPDGVWPHDLARDVIDRDLRWRDRESYDEVFRRVRAHIHRRLQTLQGVEQRRAIADEKFVFRNLPSVLSPVDWQTWGHVDTRPARSDERSVVVGLVAQFEGPDSATIAAQWWDRQPNAFFAVDAADGTVRGFVALIDLSACDPSDVDFDPGASAALAFAHREAPPRPGERVTQTRFVADRERYQAPSPTLNAVPVLTLQRYLQTPALAWDFLTLRDPDPLDDYFAIADLPRARGADFDVGGHHYGLFAHDFRRVAVDAWLEIVTDRALAQTPPGQIPATAPELVVLSHEAFTDAVRRALRDLRRPDRLAGNPLVRSRVVAERRQGGERPEVTLVRVLTEAIAALGAQARDRKRHRALEHTYLRSAPSQERVAEALGLPFSSYRRHLTEGVEQIVALLWERELHGAPPS